VLAYCHAPALPCSWLIPYEDRALAIRWFWPLHRAHRDVKFFEENREQRKLQPINTSTRRHGFLLHTDPAEATEFHWFIRDSYALIFNRTTQTGLDDSIAHHPWRHVFATSVTGISVKPQSKSSCTFEYYLWESVQSVLSVVHWLSVSSVESVDNIQSSYQGVFHFVPSPPLIFLYHQHENTDFPFKSVKSRWYNKICVNPSNRCHQWSIEYSVESVDILRSYTLNQGYDKYINAPFVHFTTLYLSLSRSISLCAIFVPYLCQQKQAPAPY
jgi:hypothetical protein